MSESPCFSQRNLLNFETLSMIGPQRRQSSEILRGSCNQSKDCRPSEVGLLVIVNSRRHRFVFPLSLVHLGTLRFIDYHAHGLFHHAIQFIGIEGSLPFNTRALHIIPMGFVYYMMYIYTLTTISRLTPLLLIIMIHLHSTCQKVSRTLSEWTIYG